MRSGDNYLDSHRSGDTRRVRNLGGIEIEGFLGVCGLESPEIEAFG
jgi:hypothetical protein